MQKKSSRVFRKAARAAAIVGALCSISIEASAQPATASSSAAASAGSAAMPPSVKLAPGTGGKISATFSVNAGATAKSVNLAGDFNEWSTDATPMKQGASGVWSATVDLTPGDHQYKFVVNGSDWKPDPANAEKIDDGHQGFNSVLHVPKTIAALAGGAAGANSATKPADWGAGATAPAGASASASGATAGAMSPFPSVSIKPAGADKFSVTFTFAAPASAKKVNLAGSFNNWSTDADAMKQSGGNWTITKELPKGDHQYKFVSDGSNWTHDTKNPNETEDGQGGKNSVLKLPPVSSSTNATTGKPQAAASPASPSAGATAGASAAINSGSGATATKSASGLPESITVEVLPGGKNNVTFRFKAPGGVASKVNLAGSFNGWNNTADPMAMSGNDWSITKELPNGDHQYKFVVDGDKWMQDPLNKEEADDNNGGMNSVLHLGVGSSIARSEEKVGDNKVNTEALLHDPTQTDFFNPQTDGSVVVKVRTAAHDITEIRLRPASVAAVSFDVPLHKEFSDDRADIFSAHVGKEVPLAVGGYGFVIKDGATQASLDEAGPHASSTNIVKPFRAHVDPKAVFATPEWARHAVWYQIFPERFRNGSKENDSKSPQFRAWTSDWFKPGPDEHGPANELGIYGRRYGGDLQGIIEKLPYLKDLGIDTLYINPIFQSVSNHKYNTTDYRHVDDEFGVQGEYARITAEENLLDPKTWKFSKSDQVLLDLIKKAHSMGMHIVVDVSYNHTGPEHPAFVDIIKNRDKSPFANWYNVTDWNKPWDVAKTPFTFEGWWGNGDLPVFKKSADGFADPGVTKHLNAVTVRWMDPNGDGDPSDGVDGWRLDVANEVPAGFWKQWRPIVKKANPNAIIIAEQWDNPRNMVQGDQFDAVMNYWGCAKPLIRFWADGKPPSTLAHDAMQYIHEVPWQSAHVMMNLMDSHDTDRLASQLANPGRSYDQGNRMQDATKNGGTFKYNIGKPEPDVYARERALAAMQFCWVGAPQIYYGDEVGMWGADDPQDRKPMVWADLGPYEKERGTEEVKTDDSLRAYYQRLAAIRNTLEPLQTGEFEILLADDTTGVFAFRRWQGDKQVVVVSCNAASSADRRVVEIPVHGKAANYIDLIGDPGVKILPPQGAKPAQIQIPKANAAARTVSAKNGKLSLNVQPGSTFILLAQ